jgi:hypothetical protein
MDALKTLCNDSLHPLLNKTCKNPYF